MHVPQLPAGDGPNEPLAVQPPWIAYPERFSLGSRPILGIAVRNLRNGRAKVWQVGETIAEEHLTSSVADLALKRDGSVAWTGVRPVPVEFAPGGIPVYVPPGSVAPPIPAPPVRRYGNRRQVVACGTGGENVIDEGEAVDLHSLHLRGSTLSWLHAGEARSAVLR